ncbi:protein of unknown function DUF1963, partial [Kipferlia bialata]
DFTSIMSFIRPLARTAYDMNTEADMAEAEGEEVEEGEEGEGEEVGEGKADEAEVEETVPHTLCDLLATKIGGIGYLGASEGLPICGQCNKPLSLMVQVSLGQLPEDAQDHLGLGDDGLIQVWMCNAQVDCNNYDGFSDAELIRYVPASDLDTHQDRDTILGLYQAHTDLAPNHVFPECPIVTLTKRHDHPKRTAYIYCLSLSLSHPR